MKTIEDLPEELRREFQDHLARQKATLAAIELESVKSTATKCIQTQQFQLYGIAIIAGKKAKTAQANLNAWKKRTVKLVSDNVHPSEGRRLREMLTPRIVADPIANLRDEINKYSEFLDSLDKRLTDGSAETEGLLKDRIRLGHIVQRRIPHLNSNVLKFSGSALESLAKKISHDLKSKTLGVEESLAEALTFEAKTLDVFLSWLDDANEIIDNLNLALTELFSFKSSKDSRGDLWIRYRFFLRMYIYEYARFRPTFRRFLKKLWSLGHIDQETRLAVAECWEMLNQEMIGARNQISHASMRVLDEERSAFLVTSLAATVNRLVVSKDDMTRLIQPAREIAKLAERMATDVGQSGRHAVAILQYLTEERYEHITEKFPSSA